jgi:hypothetical protein
MASILASWKEIANYLGKGVRTVQRWEQELGLPVRRPDVRAKGVVLAFAEELDAWVRSQPSRKATGDDGVQELHETILALTNENAALRAELQLVVSAGGAMPMDDSAELLQPNAATLPRSRQCVSSTVESIDAADAVRASIRQQRDELRVASQQALPRGKAS